ncbi:MAG: hypothetical protein DCF32_15025 [Leptolyngbya sp.]|nr:MAG: hypothetical protein DCF32_15025 [Leptolyngbya sp.]
MEINQETFSNDLAMIADRLGASIKTATAKAYFEVVSEALTADQWERAAAKMFLEYDGFKLPTPKQFIEAAIGTPEQRSQAEWHVLVEYSRTQAPCTITATAHRALAHIGGMTAM